jgi:hypothetical protein
MLLTILNIPVYAFYYQASDWTAGSPKEYFAKLSLGNLGTAEYACDRQNILTSSSLSLSCRHGTLQELHYFGMAENEKGKC